jgi:CMP-N-acetylneuraminic acid synthetase
MIPALILGRKGSKGFPGKNTFPILGRPLAWYPMRVANTVSEIDEVYLSTDDPTLMEIANDCNVKIIERPEYLCSDAALGDDAYVHGYNEIKKLNPDNNIEIVVLLFCNVATITPNTISEGINFLRNNEIADSAVTVSRYNMWSPLRARKLDKNGFLKPFVPFETFGDPETLNCDRDSQGDVLFADMGCSIVRSRCLDNLEQGLLPQKWMGKNIHPLYQEAGCDIDYEWQIPGVEWWLKKYGGHQL